MVTDASRRLQMKRTEIVVTAESFWGTERGVNLALRGIEKGIEVGENALEKHGVVVKWRAVDFVSAADPSIGSILVSEAPLNIAPMPDIGMVDIDEARSIAGTANLGELDALEDIEKSSSRTPGGREGVLKFIEERRAELKAAVESKKTSKEEKRAKKASEEAKKVPKAPKASS